MIVFAFDAFVLAVLFSCQSLYPDANVGKLPLNNYLHEVLEATGGISSSVLGSILDVLSREVMDFSKRVILAHGNRSLS